MSRVRTDKLHTKSLKPAAAPSTMSNMSSSRPTQSRILPSVSSPRHSALAGSSVIKANKSSSRLPRRDGRLGCSSSYGLGRGALTARRRGQFTLAPKRPRNTQSSFQQCVPLPK
eukprot:5016325-Amphidinium_carterae.1